MSFENLDDLNTLIFDKEQKIFAELDNNLFQSTPIDSKLTIQRISDLDDYVSLYEII